MEYIVPVQPATFSVNPVTPTQKSADAVQHNLQPYQVVQATIAAKGDGRVLLEMRGQQLWAQTSAEVKTGQQLNLQVVSTEPRLQLQMVPEGVEKYLLRLLHLFGHQPQLGTKLQQLSQALATKATQPQLQQLAHQFLGQRPPPSGTELALLAQVLGLDFEKRLLKGEVDTARNSLKGILLQLQNQDAVSAQVRENSTNLLQQLELFQLCRARLAEAGILFLPLPFNFLQQGYALIEEHVHEQQDSAEESERKSFSVVLNLALEHLGAININMLFEQGNLFVRISCAEPETITLVEHARAELNIRLEPFGLQRLNIDGGAKDPIIALLERLSPGKSMLNTQA